jgi:ClpP class serine protease
MHELIDLFSNSRWFMEPAAFRAVSSQIAKLTPETIHAAMTAHADRGTPAPEMLGDIAVIPMSGPIIYRSSWLADLFGFATIERMRAQLQAALTDPAVRTICFRCNSPGGVVDMVPEFADDIFAARGQKPIIFVADPLIASCAYWLASQGDQIIATRSSRVGAIGTYCEHEDLSGMLEQAGIKVTLIYHGAGRPTPIRTSR